MDEHTNEEKKASDMHNLPEETMNKIKEIENSYKEILKILSNVKQAQAEIANIDDMVAKTKEKSQEVLGFHGEVFSNDEKSIKNQMISLKNSWTKSNNELEKLKVKMFGYSEENEFGEDQKSPGYIDEIKERLNEHEKKYGSLYIKIEKELLSGATTVSLTKHFNVKVKEYHKARMLWERARVFLMVLGLIGFIIVAAFFTPPESLQEWLLSLSRFLPVFSIFIWLVVLMGNRCAENHKLEESYKHKEVMAHSFTGYKKSIKEISDHDNKLLNQLMQDLLNAIKHDSSAFLSAKGEKHPVTEIADTIKK